MSRIRLSLPLAVALLPLLMLISLLGPAKVMHAEPGPRPTLTPIPPIAMPQPAPEAPAAAPQEDEGAPLPTPTARPALTVVLTPVAPVRAATEGGAQQGTLPGIGSLVRTGYSAPVEAGATPANVATPSSPLAWLNVPALLIGLIVLDVIGMCVLVRRRLAR